jgi:Cys-tRNA(Pro)/Cys-tRNA(Cys) deacylase
MPNLPPAAIALDNIGIPYRLFEHDRPPKSVEEAASQRRQSPDQVVRSIVFRLNADDFIMVMMAGPGQISWKKLRGYLGISRISMASPDEVLAVTGYVRGAVTPFGLPKKLRTLADNSIFDQGEVSLGSGRRGTAIIIKSTDLKSALEGVEIGKFAV